MVGWQVVWSDGRLAGWEVKNTNYTVLFGVCGGLAPAGQRELINSRDMCRKSWFSVNPTTRFLFIARGAGKLAA